MDRQYRKNGARNICSNCDQMRAYVECFPNQSKTLYLIDLFPSSNRRNSEDSGIVLISILLSNNCVFERISNYFISMRFLYCIFYTLY